VGIHVTTIRHIEFRKYAKRGFKIATGGHYGLHTFCSKNVYTYLFTFSYLFTKKEYITVQLTTKEQSQMLPDSSINLITAISKQRSLSMCRSRLSKAANLLLNRLYFLDLAIANLFVILVVVGLVSISHRHSCSSPQDSKYFLARS